MRKPELAAAIAEETGLTKEKSNEVITVITDQNPQTGAELIIPASNTAAFKPGKGLKEKVQ